MTKITLYYSSLALIIAVQFITSVVVRSSSVQHTAALADSQRQLARLESREAALVSQLAAQTTLERGATAPTAFIAIANPVVITPVTLAAAQ